ncbi:MAG: alpha/beta hydrolase [Ilumatobacteraceae bacterium]
MGTIRVDIRQLSLLGTGLQRTSEQLLYKRGQKLTAGQIGHQKVAKAVDEFYTNWDYRREELADALSKLGGMLLDAAGIYKAAEDSIVAACHIDWPSEVRATAPAGSGAGSGSTGGGGSTTGSGSSPSPHRNAGSEGGSPYATGDEAWDEMSDEERREFLENADLDQVGNDDQNPPHMRYSANLIRVEEQIALLESKGSLTAAEAARLASYKQLVEGNPPKQILYFDPSGDGRIAVVEGDLSHASNVAVKVPGISNSLDNIGGPIGEGERLYAEHREGTAVITWLYDAPVGVSVGMTPQEMAQIGTDAMARQAAPELCQFVAGLNRGLGEQINLTVIGHSYGSLVVGLAAKQGMNVDNVVFIGSPGVGVGSVAEFNLPVGAHVYAAEPGAAASVGGVGIGGDYVSNLGHHAHPFGAVPTESGFGAEIVDIGNRGKAWESHDDYYADGSKSLHQLGRIVQGSGPA